MSDDIENPAKVHEKWDCFGQYMEIDKPWTESGDCSDKCEKRFTCWRERNPKEESGSQK